MTVDELKQKQDELYTKFLNDTAPLRTELEAKIRSLHAIHDQFKKPYDDQFAIDTAEVRADLQPQLDQLEKEHKLRCHKEAVRARKVFEKIERLRKKHAAPLVELWEQRTVDAQAAYNTVVEPQAAELNQQVVQLTEQFNRVNKPAHDQYLEDAAAIEQLFSTTAAVQ